MSGLYFVLQFVVHHVVHQTYVSFVFEYEYFS